MHSGERIGGGRYRVLSTLGLGGFGEVFLAEGPQGLVAVKVVETADWSPREYQVFNALMVSEASFLSTLSHPALPKLREFFAETTCYYLVMDWVSGETLERAVLRGGPLGLTETLELLEQLLAAFAYLHDVCDPAIVFADLKPANVLRTRQGVYRLVDFGLVTREGSRLTGDFAVYSPPFSAPERATGQPSSKRHDVYSLAATILFALLGRPPSDPERVGKALRQRLSQEKLEEIHRLRIERLSTVLVSCLEQDPAARPASLHPLRTALRRCLSTMENPAGAEPGDILRGLYDHKDPDSEQTDR